MSLFPPAMVKDTTQHKGKRRADDVEYEER